MQSNTNLSKIQIISDNQLHLIHGGTFEYSPPRPAPTVQVAGGGSLDGAGGTVMATFPVTQSTNITTHVSGDTFNGLTAGGIYWEIKV